MKKHPITQFRSDNDLTLEEFGSKFSVYKSTVMRWEEGRITAERAREIERKCGIPAKDLRPDLFGSAA